MVLCGIAELRNICGIADNCGLRNCGYLSLKIRNVLQYRKSQLFCNCLFAAPSLLIPEEIYSKYIVRVSGKGFTVVDHPSEVYGLPDAHECIDGNLPLRSVLDIDARQKPDPMNPELPSLDKYKITREDLLSRILIACADIIYYDLKHFIILNAFTLASSSNANKCSWHIMYKYAHFIDYR